MTDSKKPDTNASRINEEELEKVSGGTMVIKRVCKACGKTTEGRTEGGIIYCTECGAKIGYATK